MVSPVSHTYLVRKAPGLRVQRKKPLVHGRAIVTELSEDEGAVTHNLHLRLLIVASSA
jgi:hypothetical protein